MLGLLFELGGLVAPANTSTAIASLALASIGGQLVGHGITRCQSGLLSLLLALLAAAAVAGAPALLSPFAVEINPWLAGLATVRCCCPKLHSRGSSLCL